MMGIDVDRVIVATFFIGSALAGAAGVLVGLVFGQINHFMGFNYGLKGFTAAVVGGIGSIPGAMLGGLLIGLASRSRVGYISTHVRQLTAPSGPDRLLDPDRRSCCAPERDPRQARRSRRSDATSTPTPETPQDGAARRVGRRRVGRAGHDRAASRSPVGRARPRARPSAAARRGSARARSRCFRSTRPTTSSRSASTRSSSSCSRSG